MTVVVSEVGPPTHCPVAVLRGATTDPCDGRAGEIAEQCATRHEVLVHELRNLINTATIAFELIRSGRIPADGNTGLVLGRSLQGLKDLVDLSLVEVRLDAAPARHEAISVAAFVEEAETGALLHAQAQGLHFASVGASSEGWMEGDPSLLASALANLLQNAFKFTHKHGKVRLTTVVTADRVLFEVRDACGGLPPGAAEALCLMFAQRGSDRSGLGLGLTIARRGAQAAGGDIRVRNLAGESCIFTLDLPRASGPSPVYRDA